MRGLIAIGPSGPALFATDRVVIATGGIGGLYAESTNPLGSFGQGLALAAGLERFSPTWSSCSSTRPRSMFPFVPRRW